MIRMERWIGCLALVLYGTAVWAARAPSPQAEERQHPTTVTADRLEVNRKDHRAVYTGNVVVKTSNLTLTAHQLELDFDEAMEEVERMVAIGEVHISWSEGSKAVAGRATYYVPQEELVLEGHPKAWRRNNMVSGTRITLFINEDRQIVEGDGNERVIAVIHPKRHPEQAR